MVFALPVPWKLVSARCVLVLAQNRLVYSDNKWTNGRRLGAANEIFTIFWNEMKMAKLKEKGILHTTLDPGRRQVKLTRANFEQNPRQRRLPLLPTAL